MERGQVKVGIADLGKLGLFTQPGNTRWCQNLLKRFGVQARMIADLTFESLAVAGRLAQATAVEIIQAFKLAAHADWPVHRAYIKGERVGDFVYGFKCRTALTVDLIDKGYDRYAAQAANFEQFAGLRFDALRGVDDHDGRIDSGQCTVGVFRKILMPRRIEQIEDDLVFLECHH